MSQRATSSTLEIRQPVPAQIRKSTTNWRVLVVENNRLRRRVEDLETLVLRLQADNDRLAAAARDEQLKVEDLQLA